MLVETDLPDDPALLQAMLVEARGDIARRDQQIVARDVEIATLRTVGAQPAVHRGGERPERHFAGAVGVDAQESRAAKIKMTARPCSAFHDPPFADEGSSRDHHPVSSSLGSLMRL